MVDRLPKQRKMAWTRQVFLLLFFHTSTSSPDLIVYPVDTAKENLGLAWARTYTTLKSSGVVLQDTVFMERQNLCESSDLFHAVRERQAKVTAGLRMRTACAVWNAS